ncbi:MAG: hypothetical protein SO401_13050 [Blautia sp.]|nr:hypothetical protein [Blautia sp.]
MIAFGILIATIMSKK